MKQTEKRLEWKFYFANMALGAALRATCPKIRVGAILVKDKEVISTGYNGAPKGMKHCIEIGCVEDAEGHCVRSLHAEVNAIMKAGRDARGAELFCTHMPCIECCKLIINAGIKKIYYVFDYYDKRSLLLGCSAQLQFLEGWVKVERINAMNLSCEARTGF